MLKGKSTQLCPVRQSDLQELYAWQYHLGTNHDVEVYAILRDEIKPINGSHPT